MLTVDTFLAFNSKVILRVNGTGGLEPTGNPEPKILWHKMLSQGSYEPTVSGKGALTKFSKSQFFGCIFG